MINLKYDYSQKPPTGEQMKEYVETLYSRVPMFLGRPFHPPPHIYYLRNSDVGADALYQAVHSFNAAMRMNAVAGQDKWRIYGMHESGTDGILVSADSPSDTPLHEGIHFQGVSNESLTRALTSAYYRRASFNVGFMRQPVHYELSTLSQVECDAVLAQLRLHKPVGSDKVELVHLKYVPPAR